ncbi:hypothetical protein [Methanocella sp. MCL-LM]|uniref:hypothetical protein n=1 Tax=Methanocella sp. MCL-LM TaxID=3412035 RepID=UPI003C779B52
MVILLTIVSAAGAYAATGGPVFIQQPYEGPVITRIISDVTFELTPRATFSIDAVVKGVKPYSDGQFGWIMPYDLVLTWGKLTEPALIHCINYSQSDRQYQFSYTGCPADEYYVRTHSTNAHAVPANEQIAEGMRQIRIDSQVSMAGYLVDIGWKSGMMRYWINTSLLRDDTGIGGCEIMYIERLTIDGTTFQ